jgi:hypothetical protein
VNTVAKSVIKLIKNSRAHLELKDSMGLPMFLRVVSSWFFACRTVKDQLESIIRLNLGDKVMARTAKSNPEDKNTVAFKVNDRIHKQLKVLSIASGTPVSVLLVHAAAEYVEKHKDTINEFLSEGTEEVAVAAE